MDRNDRPRPGPAGLPPSGTFAAGTYPGWEGFRSRHAGWLDRLPPGEPVYALPAATIERLVHAHEGHPAILDEAADEAELALAALCGRARAAGYWGGRAILGTPLMPPLPADEALMEWGGYTARQIGMVKRGLARPAALAARLKGYAGWLVTEPAYLGAIASLRSAWSALPEESRPDFPLTGALPAIAVDLGDGPEPAGSLEARAQLERSWSRTRPEDATSRFVAELGAFLAGFELIGLATWDLPLPQGPMESGLPPLHSPGRAPVGVTMTWPLACGVDDGPGLGRRVLGLQRAEAEARGLDPGAAGLHKYRAYGQMLEVAHLEAVIAGRYRPRGRGRVGHVVRALADALRVKPRHVVRLRKAIASRRRGGTPRL